MKHADTSDFAKLVADELDTAHRVKIETHLGGCEACRAEHKRFLATHRLLGEWTVEAVGRDVWAAVERRLDRPMTIIPPRWRGVAAWSRVAAAIIIGIGLGHVVGRLSLPNHRLEADAIPTAQIAELVAADGLLLHALESPSPAGLFTTVLAILDPSLASETPALPPPGPQPLPNGRGSYPVAGEEAAP